MLKRLIEVLLLQSATKWMVLTSGIVEIIGLNNLTIVNIHGTYDRKDGLSVLKD